VYKHHLDVAIHVRRTDFADLKLEHTPDAAFLRFCEGASSVYVATDNWSTQDFYIDFCEKSHRECRTQDIIRKHAELAHDHRATSMTWAAIDMFSCARADRFMGTAGSSFSRTIEILRSLRK